jgi:hypothetical protein
MKPVAKGSRRSVRWFLLVACAGGVLAAGNSWLGFFHLGVVTPSSWFSKAAVNDTTELAIVGEAPIEIARSAQMSMRQLPHGQLFSRPANGWLLDSFSSPKAFSSLAWLTQESSNASAPASAQYFSTPFLSSGVVASRPLDSPTVPNGADPPPGLTSHWILNASGNWGTAANWQDGIIPSGPGSEAHFDTLNITTDVTVSVTSRSVGELYVGDTNGTHTYTFASAGASLFFDNAGAASVLTQSSTSAGDTFSLPLLLNNDLSVSNASPTNPLTITGNVGGNAATSNFQTLFFNAGNVNVSGDISNGTTGSTLTLQVNNGFVNLSGDNTYSGETNVFGGTLFVKGDSSGATGTVFVSGSGTVLGGIGTVGGTVFTFNSTITGADTTTVGTLTFAQNVFFGSSEGPGGTYLANLSGSVSDLLAIANTLALGAGSTLDIQGPADGVSTYILATFGSRFDVFETVMGIPTNYTLVYNATDLQLVPIPEPATWIGSALVLGALAFTQRRRLRRGQPALL